MLWLPFMGWVWVVMILEAIQDQFAYDTQHILETPFCSENPLPWDQSIPRENADHCSISLLELKQNIFKMQERAGWVPGHSDLTLQDNSLSVWHGGKLCRVKMHILVPFQKQRNFCREGRYWNSAIKWNLPCEFCLQYETQWGTKVNRENIFLTIG